MDSRSLTCAQAEKIGKTIGRQLNYLRRLIKRMEHQRFPPKDSLYLEATAAFNAIHKLNVSLHYLSCAPGTTMDASRPANVGETHSPD
jgi:hypothetical protein